MSGFPTLLLFCAIMAAASFAAGMLPLSLSLSQKHIRLLSILGMGVLVGTALVVIIPEGIDTLYSSLPAASHTHSLRDELPPIISDPLTTPDTHDAHDHVETPHKSIGLSLIAGFVLMYLIDVLPHTSHAEHPQHISLSSLHTLTEPAPADASANPRALTVGLLIHSLCDGIALGVSHTPALSMVIFLAITLHKAPAAFGFTAVLLRSGLGKRTVRGYLAAFAMAAPVGAVVTYGLVGLLAGEGGEEGLRWWTGIGLLFSGGTFLYVAMHAMREVGGQERAGRGEVVAAVVGMGLPLLTLVGEGHHH